MKAVIGKTSYAFTSRDKFGRAVDFVRQEVVGSEEPTSAEDVLASNGADVLERYVALGGAYEEIVAEKAPRRVTKKSKK